MKKIDLGQTITILANMGVIAGIVFLGIEIRQNQQSLDEANAINRALALREAQNDFSTFRTTLVQDEQLTEIWTRGLRDEELSEVEEARFALLCTEWIVALMTTVEHYLALDQVAPARGNIGIFWDRADVSSRFMDCWIDNREAITEMEYLPFLDLVESSRP